MTKKNTPVYVYCRTSNQNKKARSDSDSYSRQLRSIKDYARWRKLCVKEIFYDEGVCGSDLEARREFARMMEALEEGDTKTFIVSDISRFSRSVLTGEIIKARCRESGITALDASTGHNLIIDSDTHPEVNLVNTMLQAFAEFNKQKVVYNLQEGRSQAKKLGRPIGGNPAYGKKGGDKAEVPPEELALIERLKDLRDFTTPPHRVSLRTIGKILDKEGFKTRKGTQFSAQQLSRICKDNGISKYKV